MEDREEFNVMGPKDVVRIVKGRRTKRQRSSSPYSKPAAMTSSSLSSGCGGGGSGGGGGGEDVVEDSGSFISSPTTSSGIYESTEEEEDMANCLILLAQGDGPRQLVGEESDSNNNIGAVEKFLAPKFSDFSTTTTTTNKASFYVYECKTCNRSFPSFQALGGHRASHKKPKAAAAAVVEEKKADTVFVASPSIDDFVDCQLNKSSSSPDHHHHHPIIPQICSSSNNNNNKDKGFVRNKPKIHECSICGSEFTSGQALGGHMRRHRANTSNTKNNSTNNCNQVALSSVDTSVTMESSNMNHEETMMKGRTILALDLNVPAPEDDHLHRESNKFQFASTQRPPALVFSSPALVDCHY